jgi:CubicO group peptidase (beta-lactamase class C family)
MYRQPLWRSTARLQRSEAVHQPGKDGPMRRWRLRVHGPARLLLAGSVLVLCATASPAQEPFPGLEEYVRRAVADWHVPGLGLAVVRNDSVLYAKGFGVLSVGSDRAVDEHTLFEIGSSSKAFTATLVAMLVSDGVMRFDDRVSRYLPTFRLADPLASAEVTIRDALTHRSGIARGELIWLGAGVPREEVLRRVQFLQPQSTFRSRYSYQNIMFLAAGEAAGRAAGSTWDELIAQRIFRPLNMTSSVTTSVGLTNPNVARPHGSERDSAWIKPHMNMENIGPAGSILSSARDMAQWLRFQLAGGAYEGKRLLDNAPFRETHTPQILMGGGGGGGGPAGESERLTNFSTYGMGWMVQDYRSELMSQHGGNTDGMTAAMGVLPGQNFGVVVLANMASSQLPGLLMRWIFDRQLGVPPRDLAGEARARTLAQRARADSLAAQQAARRAAQPPLPLTAYAGTYADSMYGEVAVTVEGSGLQLRRGDWYGPLEYWNGTNFRWTIYPSAPTPPLFLKFEVAPDDQVTGLHFGIGGDVTLLGRRRTPAGPRAGTGGS